MLQSMRERTQGIIAGAIVGLICVTFALWGVQYYMHGNGAANVIAKVNGVKITQEELRVSIERLRRQMGAKAVFDQDMQKQLRQNVLQQLIKKYATAKAARNLGFYVDARQLQALVMQMPIFQSKGHFSYEKFQDVLSRLLYSEQEFFAEVENSLILNQLELGIRGSAFVLPTEVETALKLIKQKRNIGYFLLMPERFLTKIKIPENEVLNYYQSHQQEFMTPESISVEYIQLITSKLANQLEPLTIERTKKYYRDNIDLYSQARRWQVEKIVYKLAKNASAKEIAHAKSDLEQFAKRAKSGEDLSKMAPEQSQTAWLKPNELSSEIIDELSKLKPGQVSQPILTPDGYSLFKLVTVQAAKPIPFNQVRNQVERAITQQRLLKLFAEQNDKLSEMTYTNSDSLEPAAKALNLPIQITETFTHKGGKTGLSADPKFVKAAFSDLVLTQGYNSNPLEISPGNIVVLRIKQHNLAKARSLDEVRKVIEERLKIDAVQKMAKDLSQEIVTAWQQGKSITALTKQYNLVWHAVSNLTRDDKKLPPEVINAAFTAQLTNGSANSTPLIAVPLMKGGYALLQVTKIVDSDSSQVPQKMRIDLKNDLESKMGAYEYSILTSGFMHHAKIKIYNTDKSASGEVNQSDVP